LSEYLLGLSDYVGLDQGARLLLLHVNGLLNLLLGELLRHLSLDNRLRLSLSKLDGLLSDLLGVRILLLRFLLDELLLLRLSDLLTHNLSRLDVVLD